MPTSSRRFYALLLLCAAFLTFTFLSFSGTAKVAQRETVRAVTDSLTGPTSPDLNPHQLSPVALNGVAIAPKLGNETAKAELGRATWKYFHTVFARFPDAPTSEEKEALRTWVHLFQRLYPCGECAAHFGEIISRFPPQVSTRSAAAVWGCHVHNEVNKSLDKELFDCSKIGEFYDCGCADDEKKGKEEQQKGAERDEGQMKRTRGNRNVQGEIRKMYEADEWAKPEISKAGVERSTGINGRDTNFAQMHKDLDNMASEKLGLPSGG